MRAAVRRSHAELEAMKRQAKGLAQEYDRLLREHHQLQVNTLQTQITEHLHCIHLIINDFFVNLVLDLQNLQSDEDKKDK